MAVEVAGSIVIGITIDRRTMVLDYRCAEIQVPGNVVTRSRHAIRTTTAVVGRSEFSAEALAPDHVSGRILVLHVGRAKVAQISLTRRINAVVGS